MRVHSAAFAALMAVSSVAHSQGAPTATSSSRPMLAAPVKPVAAKPAAAPGASNPPGVSAKQPGMTGVPGVTGGAPLAAQKVAVAKPDLFASGEKKFKANDFAGALADLKQVNLADSPKDVALKRAPLLAHYTAVAEDKSGNLHDAALRYDEFVALAPKNLSKEVEQAKKRSDEIKAMPGKLAFSANVDGAEVFVDDKSVGRAPLEVSVAPGAHKLRVVAAGRDPWTGDATVGYASTGNVQVELPAAAVAAPAPVASVSTEPATPTAPAETAGAAATVATPAVEPSNKLPAYITGGVAVVALGVGTAFGIKALGHQSDFTKVPSEDSANSGENAALIADMALGVAITFGITSAVLFFTNDEPVAKTAKATQKLARRPMTVIPVPVIHSTGGGAGAVFRF
jgi:hypothetical protein